jgi:hypothetical protein
MSLNISATALAAALSTANPTQVADMLRTIGFGAVTRRQSAKLRRQNPNAQAAGVASSYDLATLQAIFLPDDAKAKVIQRVTARAANTGATGELSIQAYGVTPTTGQVAVSPCGNIVFLATDAYTDVDIDYTPEDLDIQELILPVVPATGVCLLPVASYAGTAGSGTPTTLTPNVVNNVANANGVYLLLEAEALAGTTIGKKIVVAPAASAPSTGRACLNVTKSQVFFATADAVTQARVKFGYFRAIDLNALLEANCNFF